MASEKFSGLVVQAQRIRAAMQLGGQQLTKAPGARKTLCQAKNMPSDVMDDATLLQMRLDVGA